MRDSVRKPERHWIVTALMAATPVVAAAVAGNIATMPQITGWYANLVKPWFNPPVWVFGPVWTVLFIMMGYAFYRILRLPSIMPSRSLALGLFLGQMAFNAMWSWAFFAAHSPPAGLAVIAGLWILLAGTLFYFWRLDRLSGLLLVPYLAWVSFAAILNFAIMRLNP